MKIKRKWGKFQKNSKKWHKIAHTAFIGYSSIYIIRVLFLGKIVSKIDPRSQIFKILTINGQKLALLTIMVKFLKIKRKLGKFQKWVERNFLHFL